MNHLVAGFERSSQCWRGTAADHLRLGSWQGRRRQCRRPKQISRLHPWNSTLLGWSWSCGKDHLVHRGPWSSFNIFISLIKHKSSFWSVNLTLHRPPKKHIWIYMYIYAPYVDLLVVCQLVLVPLHFVFLDYLPLLDLESRQVKYGSQQRPTKEKKKVFPYMVTLMQHTPFSYMVH